MNHQPKPTSGTRLGNLSDEQVVSLTTMLDAVRDKKDGAVLRQTVLDRLRPQLRIARPARPLTLTRLFCIPFEELLHDEPPGARSGMIARATIMPAWELARQGCDARTLDELQAAAAPLTLRDRPAAIALGRRLWPMAARAIAAHRPRRDALAEEISEIAAMLDLADQVEQLRVILGPKLVPALSESMVVSLSSLFADLASEPVGQLQRLARVAMARLAEPVALLSLLPPEVSKVTRGQIVADMERHVAAVTRMPRRPDPPPDPALVAETAETVVERIRRLADSPQKIDADPALRRLVGRVSAAVKSGVVDGSEAAILSAVCTDKEGNVSAGGFVADTATAIRAEDHAMSLKRCERIAGTIGIAADVEGAVRQAAKSTERTASELIAELNVAGPSPEALAGSETTFYRAVRLLEILGGPDRADSLRLRGEAALAAALKSAAPQQAAQLS